MLLFRCRPILEVLQSHTVTTSKDSKSPTHYPREKGNDFYEAIMHAYLDGMDTESEPFEDLVETETPESPITVAPPTSLPESTLSTLVSILRRIARMDVRVPLAMSSGLFASMAEDSKEDDDEEDEEIEESLDSNSVSEDAEDKGPTTKDEDPTARDEGLAARDEGPSMGVESRDSDDESHGLDDEGHSVESDGLGLGEEETVPKGQQQAILIMGTAVSAPLALEYEALRRQELALKEDHVYSTFEVGQDFGSALKSERPERMSTSRQPTLTTWTYPEDGGLIRDHAVRLEELSPALFESYNKDIGEFFTRSEAVRDEIFS
ncbi:hypothetical protein Tco_1415278 [Tanacetum coccineum]